jgi:hypothetical protein
MTDVIEYLMIRNRGLRAGRRKLIIMSLYNMVCGNNPLFQLYLKMIGVEFSDIPRFRDVWVKIDEGEPFVVIHTRTGGGNRDEYQAENAALGRNPNFRGDCDDDFDSTFADFTYSVPAEYRERVLELQKLLSEHPKFQSPRQKFDRAMGSIQGKAAEDKPLEIDTDRLTKLIEELATDLGFFADSEQSGNAS